MAVRSGTTSVSRVVLLGAGLLTVSALVLLAAPLGYRFGVVPLRLALSHS